MTAAAEAVDAWFCPAWQPAQPGLMPYRCSRPHGHDGDHWALVGMRVVGQWPAVGAHSAPCHPDRPLYLRSVCRRCYQRAARNRQLDTLPPATRDNRSRPEFVADYELLRSEGYTRQQIAERLGYKTRGALDQAYSRAVKAGELTRDRRLA